MLKRLFLCVTLALLALPALADVVTKKFDWQPVGGTQKIAMENNEVAISQVKFDLGDTIAPIRRSSANAKVRVDNNSDRDQEVGVAIAIFDEQGNMLAANKVGELGQGEREEFSVSFPYVYRNLRNARSFLVTLETKEKGKYHPKPTPTP